MGANEVSRIVAGLTQGAVAPAIELRGVHKHYGQQHVVKGLDLALPAGSFLVLLGPSGCGKSTLLRMLSGLEAPTQGALHILGREVANGSRGVIVPPGERRLGLVFQSYALWPHMTVRGNVEWPLKVARQSAEQRRRRVDEVLAQMDIGTLSERYPSEISGGQQQRVAIARMLAPAPGLLLFDEPLSNLDAKLRVEMRSELLRVHRESGATSVYVTHDQIEAMTMATHVAVMNEGRIEQFGTPRELLEAPASPFVATFVGTPSANVLDAAAREGSWYIGGQAVAAAASGIERARLMYHAADLTLLDAAAPADAAAASVAGTLLEVAPMAGRYVCTALVDGTRVSVLADQAPAATIGAAVALRFPPRPRAIFDADTAVERR